MKYKFEWSLAKKIKSVKGYVNLIKARTLIFLMAYEALRSVKLSKT